MINQQCLNTFLTLADIGHFTQTAEKLNMTQPGVSQQIKKLEDQVGAPLLNRIGKRFELTREGELLYKFGRKSAQEEEQLFTELRFDDPYSGECRIACSGTMTTFLYPQFLERQKEHSELVITVEAAPNVRIIESLTNNSIDLGIVTQPDPGTELLYESLGFDSLCLVLPSAYASHAINFDALNEIGFIDHPDGAHYADRVLSANYGDQFQSVKNLRKTGYINQINQILVPVSEGLGFTVLPEMAVRFFTKQALLHIASLKIPIHDELFLVRKKHRKLPKRYEWFERKIKELLRKA